MPNLCSLLFFVICELCLLLDFCFVNTLHAISCIVMFIVYSIFSFLLG